MGAGRDTGHTLGQIDFGSDTSTYFREKIQAHWFAYWLKDEGPLNQPEALVFQTGTNKWASYDQWPPRQGIRDRKLYFHSGGRLSFEPPETDSEDSLTATSPTRPIRCHTGIGPFSLPIRAEDGRRGWWKISASFIFDRTS